MLSIRDGLWELGQHHNILEKHHTVSAQLENICRINADTVTSIGPVCACWFERGSPSDAHCFMLRSQTGKYRLWLRK